MRPSDLYGNLHTALRFYKNNYTVRTTQEQILSILLDNIQSSRILEFNYISQSYHGSLSYIIGQKQRERERKRERARERFILQMLF